MEEDLNEAKTEEGRFVVFVLDRRVRRDDSVPRKESLSVATLSYFPLRSQTETNSIEFAFFL